MKKVMSLIMVLCLAFALAVPAFADDAATAGSAEAVAKITTPEQLTAMNQALVADKGFVNEAITSRARAILRDYDALSQNIYASQEVKDGGLLKKQEAHFASNGADEALFVNSMSKEGNNLHFDITRTKNGQAMSVEEQMAEGPALVRLYLDRDALDPAHNDYTWTCGEMSGVAVVGYITDYCYVEFLAPHFSSYSVVAQPKAEKVEPTPAPEEPEEPEAPAPTPAPTPAPAATTSVLAATGADMTCAAVVIIALAAVAVAASAVVLKKRDLNK